MANERNIPSILPGDTVVTPDGEAYLVRIEGDEFVTRHTVRSDNSPGTHPTSRREERRHAASSCRRLLKAGKR